MTEQEATKEAIRQLECANTGKGLSIDWSDGKDILAVTVVLGEPAEAIIAALREKAEREKPKPLTLKELAEMEGKPVYDAEESRWRVIESVYDPDEDYDTDLEGDPHTIIIFTDGVEMDYETDFRFLYAHEPKGAAHE